MPFRTLWSPPGLLAGFSVAVKFGRSSDGGSGTSVSRTHVIQLLNSASFALSHDTSGWPYVRTNRPPCCCPTAEQGRMFSLLGAGARWGGRWGGRE